MRDGLLIEFELQDERNISAPRVAWVSQPSEWCASQLLDAALLTLDIAERALSAGFELKDASAWNVLFDGSTPVFCDHLSFEPIHRREWHAFGQFARHFILPLLVAERRGLPIHAQFRMYRDGIAPQLARQMCGWRMMFSRAAPLALATRSGSAPVPEKRHKSGGVNESHLHENLFRYARFSLPSRQRIEERHKGRASAAERNWSAYLQERDHYSANALAAKAHQVRAWIERLAPRWVLDLGANTGEFTLLAAQCGARVVAVDSDHACIDRLYSIARNEPAFARTVFPVVAQLDDICGGRGWRGREAPGIESRLAGHSDLVLMLGLLHHLMIAGSIPISDIAAFAAELTRNALIVEIIPEDDPMFCILAEQYSRTGDAARVCGQGAQVSAFAPYFDIVERCALPDSSRTLLLLTKRTL